ncbi:MAG: undecaprenyldiphospho-muramoylpentapeptide beta-N-acetylglucosaminyltransferase [Alphaproteobacteria bacterium]
MSARTIVLAAGGTGGHLFPAEALAQEMQARGHRLVLVTDRRGAGHSHTLANLETHVVRAGSMAGGVGKKVGGLMNVVAGVFQARALLPRLQPHAVVGFGGYPSLPTMLAAARLGTPATIHEQNAVLGRVNRLLAPRVDAIALSFPHTERIDSTDRSRATVTGTPVRPEILVHRDRPYRGPDASGDIRLLVFGGSQGANVFSRVVPAALGSMDESVRRRLRIVQQCRLEDLEATRVAYADLGIAAELGTFFDDLPRRMADSHLVIGRAGASTIFELAAMGRPALLVPYPHATDDHQTANANAFSETGAGWTIQQSAFSPSDLFGRLNALFSVPHYLEQAAAASRRFGIQDASSRLADLVDSLAGSNGQGGQSFIQGAAA